MPAAVFLALEKEAAQRGSNCSEWLLRIQEKELGKKITVELDLGEKLETNLVSAKVFANQYERSVEQAKQYLRKKGRVEGGIKLGRDWLIPREARLPEDLRGKRKNSRKRKVVEQECADNMQ